MAPTRLWLPCSQRTKRAHRGGNGPVVDPNELKPPGMKTPTHSNHNNYSRYLLVWLVCLIALLRRFRHWSLECVWSTYTISSDSSWRLSDMVTGRLINVNFLQSHMRPSCRTLQAADSNLSPFTVTHSKKLVASLLMILEISVGHFTQISTPRMEICSCSKLINLKAMTSEAFRCWPQKGGHDDVHGFLFSGTPPQEPGEHGRSTLFYFSGKKRSVMHTDTQHPTGDSDTAGVLSKSDCQPETHRPRERAQFPSKYCGFYQYHIQSVLKSKTFTITKARLCYMWGFVEFYLNNCNESQRKRLSCEFSPRL